MQTIRSSVVQSMVQPPPVFGCVCMSTNNEEKHNHRCNNYWGEWIIRLVEDHSVNMGRTNHSVRKKKPNKDRNRSWRCAYRRSWHACTPGPSGRPRFRHPWTPDLPCMIFSHGCKRSRLIVGANAMELQRTRSESQCWNQTQLWRFFALDWSVCGKRGVILATMVA